jgi:hypothetical protein
MGETFLGLRHLAYHHGIQPDCTTRTYVTSFLRVVNQNAVRGLGIALCRFLIEKSGLSERPKSGRYELLPIK